MLIFKVVEVKKSTTNTTNSASSGNDTSEVSVVEMQFEFQQKLKEQKVGQYVNAQIKDISMRGEVVI